MSERHIAVVGAGIIGLASAYHLVRAGVRVTVIDRDLERDCASMGNAGGIAVTEVYPASSPGVWWRVFRWISDPLGPLAIRPTYAPRLLPWLVQFARASSATAVERISKAIAALNARVYEDLLPMLEDLGLSDHLHRRGALHVYESDSGYRRDAAEWACKQARGIVVEHLTSQEARRLEPALGPLVYRAVFTPQWSHVSDPRELVRGLRNWLASRGVKLQRASVRHVTGSSSAVMLNLDVGGTLEADQVVIAAGAWSGILARRIGDRVLLESERGYNMTLPRPGIVVERQLVFAERKLVATPLTCGLRIGGAAEFGGLQAKVNFRRSQALVELARRYLPGLQTEGGTPWAGDRPATPDSLPVIGASPREPRVFYAFGHGHLGLTQSATTGRLVADMILDRPAAIDLAPYSIDRFSSYGGLHTTHHDTTNSLLH